MNTKVASEKFNLDKKVIYTLCKDGLIKGAHKENKKWVIPDNTAVILTKSSIKHILIQILKLKNVNNCPISYVDIDSLDNLIICINYLFKMGYISKYDKTETDINKVLLSCVFSDEGFEIVLGKNNQNKIAININCDLNFNLIKK